MKAFKIQVTENLDFPILLSADDYVFFKVRQSSVFDKVEVLRSKYDYSFDGKTNTIIISTQKNL